MSLEKETRTFGAPQPLQQDSTSSILEKELQRFRARTPRSAAEYERARNHKWYMSARMICLNDLYTFDSDLTVAVEDFEDIIGRHFHQPEEGLGNDNTPASHMWRTIRRPSNAL